MAEFCVGDGFSPQRQELTVQIGPIDMDSDFEVNFFLEGELEKLHFGKEQDEYSNEDALDDVEETIILEEYEEYSTSELNLFDLLPDEIVSQILSCLTLKELCRHVAPVCQKWLAYSRDPLLWQKLRFEVTCLLQTEDLILLIQKKCPLLKELSLRCRSTLSEHCCRHIANSCPMLQVLSLAFCSQLNKRMVEFFVNFCPNLRELNLEGCNISDDCLYLLIKLPLKKLNVSHCTHLSDDGLIFVSKKCYNLQDINFDGVQWISGEAVAIMVQNCQCRLHNLWLDGANLTDDSVRLIARCKELRTFSLSFCDFLTDASLVWIQTMHKLVSLQLKKGCDFSSKGLRELFVALHPSTTGSPSGLRHLSVAECTGLDDTALQAIADSCQNLLTLDLSWCWDVTDAGLQYIVTKCHNVVDLNLCGLNELLGEPLKELPQEMPKLTYLDGRQCNKVPDNLLEQLAWKMTKLTVLNYYGEQVRSAKFSLERSAWSD